MRTRTLLAAPVAALALVVATVPAGATPTPSPNPTQHAVNILPAGPTAVLDVPDERTESDHFSPRIVLDASTADPRRPIVEQWLVITEPDGDRSVLAWIGAPGSHAQTSVLFDEDGTWTFTLTVTNLMGASDTVTETVQVWPDLSQDPPGHDDLPGA